MPDAMKYRPLFEEACLSHKSAEYCSEKVLQSLMAVSRHETCFSECKPFIGAFNFGAIQCGKIADKDGRCPANCIPARDTSPTSTGASISYLGCFEAKPSAQVGIARFVKLMTVDRPGIAAALPSGDAREIATAMRKAYYFEGFGRTQEERIEGYAKAIDKNARLNAQQLHASLLVELPPLDAPSPPLTPEELGGGFTVAALFAGLVARLQARASASTP